MLFISVLFFAFLYGVIEKQQTNQKAHEIPETYLGEIDNISISKFEPSPGKTCYLAKESHINSVSIWCEPDKNK